MASASAQQAVSPVTNVQTSLSSRRRLEDLGLVMLVGFAPLIVSATYLLIVPVHFTPDYVTHRFAGGLAQEFAILILFVIFLRRQGRGVKTIGLTFQWTDLPKGLGLFLLSYLASCLFFWSAEVAYYAWKHTYFHPRDAGAMFAGVPVALMIVYGIAASWFEETLVRGYLMTELIAVSCPVWLAAALSVVLQTAYHLYYGVAGALFVGVGFAISAIYFARSRRLMPVILSHLFWDLTATYLHWHR